MIKQGDNMMIENDFDKSVNKWYSMNSSERYEIMQKVEKAKTARKYLRNCIMHIKENKLF